MLYAFSGFQLLNTVFNNFHDITAIFPLVLVALDDLVYKDKKFFFAFVVAILAMTNYFFFFEIVVFLIIYFLIKLFTKQYLINLKIFSRIAFESILGVCLSAFIFIPSVLEVLSNSRINDSINGMDIVSYADRTIIPRIIYNLFVVPDSPTFSTLFPAENNLWASISAYIPLFSMVGVISFVKAKRKDWVTKLILVCALFAIIPLFNSVFCMFNSVYYARWFFMPLLFMVIATVKVLEDEKIDLKIGIKVTAVVIAIIAIVGIMPREIKKEDKIISKWFEMPQDKIYFWQSISFSAIMLLVVFYLYRLKKEKKDFFKKSLTISLSFIIITSVIYHFNVRENLNRDNTKEKFDFDSKNSVILEEDEFYRISNINGLQNNHFIWGYNSTQTFHSVVPASVFEFYERTLNLNRMMQSDFTYDYYPLSGLLSVKYAFNESTGDDLNVERIKATELKGHELYNKQNFYYIYKNNYFVPMGFTYDYLIADSDLEKYIKEFSGVKESVEFLLDMALKNKKEDKLTPEEIAIKRLLIMMRAIVVEDSTAEKYENILPKLSEEYMEEADEKTYYSDCIERAKASCYEFEYDGKGFNAKINSEKENLLYFSVPYHKGWSAKVNGESVKIEKVNYGFVGVPIKSGENTIEFSFMTPGLKFGLVITISSILISICYVLFFAYIKKKNNI